MDFPIFFLPALAVTALLIVTVVVYFQVYKRNKKKRWKQTQALTHRRPRGIKLLSFLPLWFSSSV